MMIFFFYGTLKQGHGNNILLKGSTFLGEFATEAIYTMLNCGGFPGVICKGDTSISGELYEVTNDETIKRLYTLEGYTGVKNSPHNWYDLEEINTPYGIGNMFVFKNLSRIPKILKESIVESGKW